MTYEVTVHPRVEREIEQALTWMERKAPSYAERWLNELHAAITSLAELPERGAIAPESEGAKDRLREIFFGDGRNVYRLLYTVQGRSVRVLNVRHGARARIRAEDSDS